MVIPGPGPLHWCTLHDAHGEPYGETCRCPVGEDHDESALPPPLVVPQSGPVRMAAVFAQLGTRRAEVAREVFAPDLRGPFVHLQIGQELLTRVTCIEFEPPPSDDPVEVMPAHPLRHRTGPPVMKVTLSIPLAEDRSSYSYLEGRYDLGPGDLRQVFTQVLVDSAGVILLDPAESGEVAVKLIEAMNRFLAGGA